MFDSEKEIEMNTTATMMQAGEIPYRNPTVTERLKMQKQDIEARLAEINSVLEALESNPEVQKVVDAVSKIRGI